MSYQLHEINNSDAYEATKKDVLTFPFIRHPFLILHLTIKVFSFWWNLQHDSYPQKGYKKLKTYCLSSICLDWQFMVPRFFTQSSHTSPLLIFFNLVFCMYLQLGYKNSTSILPGKFHGQRSLVGYSPWSHKELDMTEHACTHLSFRQWTVHKPVTFWLFLWLLSDLFLPQC